MDLDVASVFKDFVSRENKAATLLKNDARPMKWKLSKELIGCGRRFNE